MCVSLIRTYWTAVLRPIATSPADRASLHYPQQYATILCASHQRNRSSTRSENMVLCAAERGRKVPCNAPRLRLSLLV